MSKIKAFSDLQQSKKLAKILSPKSADMFYIAGKGEPVFIGNKMVAYGEDDYDCLGGPDVLCWSLAALIDVLPSRLFDATPKRKELNLLPDLDKSYCFYRQFAVKTKGEIYLLTEGKCLIDACVAMIEKLHKLNLL